VHRWIDAGAEVAMAISALVFGFRKHHGNLITVRASPSRRGGEPDEVIKLNARRATEPRFSRRFSAAVSPL